MLLFEILLKLRKNFPAYLLKHLYSLVPLNAVSSLSELLGIGLIIPIIALMTNESIITTDIRISFIFNWVGTSDKYLFVLILFGGILLFFLLKNMISFLIYKKNISIAHKICNKISIAQFDYYFSDHTSWKINDAVIERNIKEEPMSLVYSIFVPISLLVNELFFLLLILIIFFFYEPIVFSIIIVVSVPLFVFFSKRHKKAFDDFSETRNENSKKQSKTLHNSVSLKKEIVVYDKFAFFRREQSKRADDYYDSYSRLNLINAFYPKATEVFSVFIIFCILMFGYLLSHSLSHISSFIVVFSASSLRIIPSLNKVLLYYNQIKASEYVLDELKFFEPTHENESGEKEVLFKDRIELEEVEFRYPGSSTKIFDQLNLTIRRGEIIGIVGPSGAGKTSIIKLLLLLIKANDGDILIDGRSLSGIAKSSWYKLISYVPQKPLLLDGTIKQNIAFGIDESKIDVNKINEILSIVGLADFVNTLDKKLDTELGNEGMAVSGGQAQRLVIARALYHDGEIFVFDEATSALDKEMEEIITENIYKIANLGKTIIIVSHHKGPLKYCNKIYFLNNGKLQLL